MSGGGRQGSLSASALGFVSHHSAQMPLMGDRGVQTAAGHQCHLTVLSVSMCPSPFPGKRTPRVGSSKSAHSSHILLLSVSEIPVFFSVENYALAFRVILVALQILVA
jgi:hypothetical protein